MLIARYEVSYEIIYLHNAYPPCNFPPSNPINADANYAIPNNFVLETLCSVVSRDSRELSLARRSPLPTPSTVRRKGTRCSNLGQIPACSVRNPWREKAKRYLNAVNTPFLKRTKLKRNSWKTPWGIFIGPRETIGLLFLIFICDG